MLKHRLLFGVPIITIFTALVLLDGYLDGSISPKIPTKPIQASILAVLIVMLVTPVLLELQAMVKKIQVRVFTPVTWTATILIASSFYFKQFAPDPAVFNVYYITSLIILSIFGLCFYQGWFFDSQNMIINCGVNLFTIIYLGFMSSFFLGMRVDFGLWHLLMFILTVKFSDIGAYTFGKNFGKTKFSPKISPNKTWEGVIGGCIFAAIVAVLFAVFFDIMLWYQAIVFGVLLAFLGQLGDLIESMVKRNAQVKDSGGLLPGFGGLLDLIDSPLATSPVAYVFFLAIT